MKQVKIKNLTKEEAADICNKSIHNCDECKLNLGFCCYFNIRRLLEIEVEVEEE